MFKSVSLLVDKLSNDRDSHTDGHSLLKFRIDKCKILVLCITSYELGYGYGYGTYVYVIDLSLRVEVTSRNAKEKNPEQI